MHDKISLFLGFSFLLSWVNMVARDFSVIVFSLLSASVFASHFRGGLIQWKSVDSNTVGNNMSY